MLSISSSENIFNEDKFHLFCQKNNLEFPQYFIEFLRIYNDGELEDNHIEGDEECSIRYFFGTTDENYSDIAFTYDCYMGRMPHNCIPIAEAEGGNLLCISLAQDTYGKIYFWDHESMDVEEYEECPYTFTNMPLIANHFDDILNKISRESN